MNNSKGKFKIILLVIIVFGIIAVGTFLALRKIVVKPEVEVLETDVFINSGGFGGSTAAIELSKNNINFIMIEESDWLGGQATSQGVSSLDEHSRGFQRSGIYQEILSDMMVDKDKKKFIANAATGPGAPPQKIQEILSDKLKAHVNNIYLNSQIISVDYNQKGKNIRSVVFEDKKTGKRYKVKAKFFLDSSDFSELIGSTDINLKYGLDAYEETGEFLALTNEERDIFVNGTTYQGQFIGGFGNRGQSITSPMMIGDTGYVGYKFEIPDLVNPQAKLSDCVSQKGRKCFEITTASEEFVVSLPSKQKFKGMIILDGKYEYIAKNDFQLTVNSEVIDISNVNFSTNDNFSFFTFPIESTSEFQTKIVLSSAFPFKISTLILNEENKLIRKSLEKTTLTNNQEFFINESSYYEIKSDNKDIKNIKLNFLNGSDNSENFYDGNSIVRFLGKTGERISVNYEGQGNLSLTRLNKNHYFAGVFDNFESENRKLKYDLPGFQTGKFKIYLEAFDQVNNSSDTPNVKVNLQGKELLNKTLEVTSKSLYELGEINIDDYLSLQIEIESDCNSCFKYRIFFDENMRKQFDSAASDKMFKPVKLQKKLFSSNRSDDFFAFRRTVDPDNLNKDNLKYVGITEPNYFLKGSTGVTYINTLQNDYSFDEVDYKTFFEDKNKRQEIINKSMEITQNLYYWLKYDNDVQILSCGVESIICSGLRISMLPKAMGTENGISQTAYIRETPRPEGQTTLTSNDFLLMPNLCTLNDECTNLKYGDQIYRVKNSFLNEVRDKPVLSFYYPTDQHAYVSSGTTEEIDKLNQFNEYIKNVNLRDKNTKPYFWNGMFEFRIKPGVVTIFDMYSTKVENIMFCGKNISVTQIANGSTRLHPAESAIGQVCGVAITYAIKNNLDSVQKVAEEYDNLIKEIVKSGIYPLPYDDVKINEYMNADQTELPTAYFMAWYDRILTPKVQVSEARITMYYFDSLSLAKKEDLKRALDKLEVKPTGLFNTDFDTISFSALQNILKKEDFEKWQKYIIEHRCKDKKGGYREKNDSYCIEKVFPRDSFLTRGDLAYVFDKLKTIE